MDNNILLNRDLLYPTDNLLEPGCIYVEVQNPGKKAKLPVIIEAKTQHSPVKYMSSILRILQGDIFDRILIDLKNNADIYIKATGELKETFGGKSYILVVFNGDKTDYIGMDAIDN